MVMGDMNGQLTTRLNAAFEPLKDNRLLPLGFRTDHAAYDTVAIWGDANLDPEYSIGSASGLDIIEYRIPLNGNKGVANLDVSLHYQTLPSRWMSDLFDHDSIPQVAQFKSMYADYKIFEEIVDQHRIDSIDLSPLAILPIASITTIELFPNPLDGTTLQINLNDPTLLSKGLRYDIVTPHGKTLQKGFLTEILQLDPAIKTGVYFFILYDSTRLVCVKPFVVL